MDKICGTAGAEPARGTGWSWSVESDGDHVLTVTPPTWRPDLTDPNDLAEEVMHDAFAAAMSSLGIGNDTVVVAYDDTGGLTAGRLAVMLRMLGHDAAGLPP
jgi:thiosulfate/3-mercaptopyruvate sulfurtransferase